MNTLISSALLALCALPVSAFACEFTTECFETDACIDTTFSIDVDVPLQTVSTDLGDLEAVAVKAVAGNFVMFASGGGAEYMLVKMTVAHGLPHIC